MPSSRSLSYGLIVVAFFFLTFTQISALPVEYCSSLNTGQTPTNSSIFQSNGLCYNFCLGDWAFAILQVDTCYCSNEAPGITTPVSNCDFQCHGYPDDKCGSDSGLFGYIALSKSPTATVDAGVSSTSATLITVTDAPSATTIFDTLTATASSSPTSTSSAASTTNSPSSSSKQIISSPPSSTWTPTPVISLETVTGQIRTVTVTPTIPPNSPSLTGVKEKNSGGIGVGGAVGLTVGLVALVALVCSIIYFCLRRRQKEKRRAEAEAYTEESQRGSSAGLGGPIPSRTMSENSRYILGTDGRQVVETWEPESRDAPGSRKSRLMPVDPRLDPHAPLYQRGENISRESINTIRDDHDYSRRVHQQGPILRATNPDD